MAGGPFATYCGLIALSGIAIGFARYRLMLIVGTHDHHPLMPYADGAFFYFVVPYILCLSPLTRLLQDGHWFHENARWLMAHHGACIVVTSVVILGWRRVQGRTLRLVLYGISVLLPPVFLLLWHL